MSLVEAGLLPTNTHPSTLAPLLFCNLPFSQYVIFWNCAIISNLAIWFLLVPMVSVTLCLMPYVGI